MFPIFYRIELFVIVGIIYYQSISQYNMSRERQSVEYRNNWVIFRFRMWFESSYGLEIFLGIFTLRDDLSRGLEIHYILAFNQPNFFPIDNICNFGCR